MVSTKKGISDNSMCYLHIISRNNSNTLLLINLQNQKLVQSKPQDFDSVGRFLSTT